MKTLNKIWNFIKKYGYWLFIIVCIIGIIGIIKKCSSDIEQNKYDVNLINSLQDSLIKTINSKGELENRISIIETNSANEFLSIKTKDSTIKALQAKVTYYSRLLKHEGSVANFTTTTEIDTCFVPMNVHDTTYDCDYEENITQFSGWITGKVRMTPDTFQLKLKIANEFSMVLGYEPQGLFKQSKPVAILTDANPYTSVSNLKVYKVKAKPRHIVRNILIGTGIGLIGGSIGMYCLIH